MSEKQNRDVYRAEVVSVQRTTFSGVGSAKPVLSQWASVSELLGAPDDVDSLHCQTLCQLNYDL